MIKISKCNLNKTEIAYIKFEIICKTNQIARNAVILNCVGI